jgi:outer membrane lipoprotein-sorting protein
VRFAAAVCVVVACALGVGAADAAAPPKGVDEKLWKQMLEINARGAAIKDLRAGFVQEKFTPLLKKPLVSSGQILVKGSASLWTTTAPEPTVMRIDAKEVRLLYPKQKVMEVYAIDQKMGALAASPLPQLDTLKERFSFERIAVKEVYPEGDEVKHLALRMRPTDAEIQKHVDEVAVVLDVASGCVVRARTIDADGDRIVLTFSNPKINTGLADAELELAAPAGVSVSHPLEGRSEKPRP